MLPAPVAATGDPTMITVDQATANAVADRWFPSVTDLDIPPTCGGSLPIECPGGTPRDPSTNLRLTTASRSSTPIPPSEFDLEAQVQIETLDPIAVNTQGIECTLTIDTSAGASSTITVRTRATVLSSPILGYNYVAQGDTVVSGLESADLTFGDSLLCTGLDFGSALAVDLLERQLADLLQSRGPLCGVAGPDLVAICPWLTVPSSVDFGDQPVGSTSAAQPITVLNAGPGSPYLFDIGLIMIEGPGAADFSISADGCSNTTLWNGACTIDVSFRPAVGGHRSAFLSIPSTWVESPADIALTGNGVVAAPPVANVTPSSLSFGNVRVGSPSASQQLTVTAAAGGGSLHLGTLTTTGIDASDFGIGSDQCSGTTLVAGGSCTVLVTLLPAARGARSATLQVPDDAADSPQTAALTGTGVAPVASIAPPSVNFGTVMVGATSSSQVITITNAGDTGQTLSFTSAVLGGTNASDFTLISDGCVTAGALLDAGTSCQMAIRFTPAAAGARSATLSIRDNAGDSPQAVSLSGTGGTPSADLAVGISAATGRAKAKGRVTYTITVYNAGPSSALSLLLNDTLSSQTTFVSANPSHGSCVSPLPGASGIVACSLGTLANGASAPVQIVVTVIAKKGSVTNTVTISSSTTDPNLVNNTASITIQVH